MELKEYQEEALKRLNPTIANKDKESMRFACMGLLEEAGEVVAELRKPLYKGNFHEKALNKKAITSELGDVMWYIALTCRNNDIDIEKLESKIDANKYSFDREKLIKYVQGVQYGSPIDANVTAIPWDMPGYDDQVIMASGSFTQGSSIEFSCDAPIREPYIAYQQGGLTYEYGKLGLISAIENLEK